MCNEEFIHQWSKSPCTDYKDIIFSWANEHGHLDLIEWMSNKFKCSLKRDSDCEPEM